MRVYILPTSDQGLGDRCLTVDHVYRGGMQLLPFLDGLSDALKKMGHEVHTSDLWSRDNRRPDDILVIQDHPVFTLPWILFHYFKRFRSRGGFVLARRKFLFENYRFFKRRFLIHAESPMITKYFYRHFKAIEKSGIYDEIMTTWRGYGDYFNLYDYRNQSIASPFLKDKKEKFLILLNGNARPRVLFKEFYSERLRAIKYFSNVPGFDLYGGGWNKPVQHPFFRHYKKYVDKVWRGRAADKMEIMSQYKFTICYENAPYNGYITEKIYDCLAAGTIPIYLGAPDIAEIVPPDCFIDFRKFNGYPELHHYLTSLTEADLEKYRQNIFRFLSDQATMKGMKGLAEKVLGLS